MSEVSTGEPAAREMPRAVGAARRRSLRRTVAIYASGNGLATGISTIAGLLTVRLVEPAVLGAFNGVMLAVQYVPFLGLGVFDGLARELPYCYGRGEENRAFLLASVAQFWAVCVGGACGTVMGCVAAYHALHFRWDSAAAWTTASVSAFLTFYATNYLKTLYRTSDHFERLSRGIVARALVGLALVATVAYMAFYGLCLRALGIALAEAAYLWWWRPVRGKPRLEWNSWKQLIMVGLPIMAAIQVNTLWYVFNRTLILWLLGERALGLYFYPMLYPALALLPFAIQQILYPRTTELYGRRGSVGGLVSYMWMPTLLVSGVMAVVVVAGWFMLPHVVAVVLPKYVEGVPAVWWALLDGVMLSLLTPRSIFFTVRRQGYYIASTVVGIGAYLGVLLWLGAGDLRLEHFPQALILGRVCQWLCCVGFLYHLIRCEEASAHRDD